MSIVKRVRRNIEITDRIYNTIYSDYIQYRFEYYATVKFNSSIGRKEGEALIVRAPDQVRRIKINKTYFPLWKSSIFDHKTKVKLMVLVRKRKKDKYEWKAEEETSKERFSYGKKRR